MDLSVVILNYNASVFLELCVESCIQALEGLDGEIIVVDNDSSDDSMQRLTRNYKNIKTIYLDKNYGFSKANNIAVERARGTYICLINPDVIVSKSAFAQVLDFARVNSNIGFVGVQLIDGAGRFLPESKRRTPTIYSACLKLLGSSNHYYDNRLQPEETGPTDVLVGAFLMGEKQIYQDLGGLDERYFMYGEDIDLSYTALQKGLQNYYIGSAIALHFKGESTLKDTRYYRQFYKAMALFYKKHYRWGSTIASFVFNSLARFKGVTEPSKWINPQDTSACICVSAATDYHPEWADQTVSLRGLTPHFNNTTVIFDLKTLEVSQVLRWMATHKDIQLRYRFLTVDRSAYAGSDRSDIPGEVHIWH